MATRKSSSRTSGKSLKGIEAAVNIRSAEFLVDKALKHIGVSGGELDISLEGEDVLLLRALLNETKSRLITAARAVEVPHG